MRGHRLWLVWACIALPLPAWADDKSFETYWSEANAKPHKTTESSNCIEIVADDAIYLFTKPNNPDHPALFIRKMTYRDGKLYVVTKAHSFRPGVTKPDLKAWMDNPFQPPAEQKGN